jgi:hypothetical protein
VKIGWYTHHIENVTNVAHNASVGQESALNGLFSGRFAGGAEMSDYEYRLQAPLGFDIQIVTPETFDTHDIHQFDSVVLTGTDLFTDQQLNEISKHEPFVFVHHLQTPRAGLNTLIRSSRLFVTHTPAHLRRELAWTKPRKTAQVLSYFDTSKCYGHMDKQPFALWAARSHPLKGKLKAEIWAAQGGYKFKALSNVPRDEVLDAMARCEWFVHLPLAFESECRAVMEAVLSGCRIHTNENVGLTSIEDWQDKDHLRHMIDNAGDTFWRLVQQ